jgi:peptidoglycan/LPS O-acetylase OafA/YrhL
MNASVFGPSLTFISTFPGNWIAILIAAELSFYLVEQPALRLRNRLMRHLPSASSKAAPLVERG